MDAQKPQTKITRDNLAETMHGFSITGRGLNPTVIKFNQRIFAIRVKTLPSWNEIIYLAPDGRATFIRKERELGYTIGLQVAKILEIPIVLKRAAGDVKDMRKAFKTVCSYPVTTAAVICYCKVWREGKLKAPDEPKFKRDLYNASLKGVIDGIIDAGIFIDDNERFHQGVYIDFEGTSLNPHIDIEFYLKEYKHNEQL